MSDSRPRPPTLPPGASPRARRLVRFFVAPVERFLHVEAASGVILLAAAAVALALSNSRFREAYEHLLHAPVVVGVGEYVFRQSIHFWVNDVLMVVFFFVVGLEVRREIFEGALSSARRAALPVAAAVGGMVAPAAIYVALNRGGPGLSGWGVPMATDIAFAVGVLAILGKRVHPNVRVLLLALAIIDDIGAILVIAFFYSSGVDPGGLWLAGAGVAAVVAMQRVGIRTPAAYVPPGGLVWAGTLRAGIHPTIAGVILGLLTPARSWFGLEGFAAEAERALEDVRALDAERRDPHALLPLVRRMARAAREALPPVSRLEAALHPWVAYGVMPIFALANAGVSVGGLGDAPAGATQVGLGTVLGLVAGKPLGVLAAGVLAVKVGLATLPPGVTWRGVTVVGLVAGIGFTMSLFIGTLAFADPALLAVAKAAVLAASAVAGVLGLAAGLVLLPRQASA